MKNEGAQEYWPATGTPVIGQGTTQHAGVLALLLQYIKHRKIEARPSDAAGMKFSLLILPLRRKNP